MNNAKLGEYAFLAGVVVALIAGLIATYSATSLGATAAWVPVLLVALGIVVGFLNIADKESQAFLVSAIVLVVASTAKFADLNTAVPTLGTLLNNLVGQLAVFVAPAAIIIAVKAIWAMGKGK